MLFAWQHSFVCIVGQDSILVKAIDSGPKGAWGSILASTSKGTQLEQLKLSPSQK
jgi:hypothetical protein